MRSPCYADPGIRFAHTAPTQPAFKVMMPSQSTNVFVSYSHADAPLVAPVVELLRANKSLVFRDTDSIPSGKRWRSEIAEALTESHLVVVFWCDHASRSDEVSKEWKAAIEQKKDLLPLLLDATPLPPGLDEFQWIDFRGMVGASHSSIGSRFYYYVDALRSEPAAWLKSARWLSGLVAAVVAVALLDWHVQPSGTIIQPQLHWLILLIGVVFFAWLLRWRAEPYFPRPVPSPDPHPGEIERRIANELEAEIIRRIGHLEVTEQPDTLTASGAVGAPPTERSSRT